MKVLSLEFRKDNTYYDRKGKQILEGDLLKVFHFIGARRKKHYMYQIAVIEDKHSTDPDAFPVMSIADYRRGSKPHCRMYVLVNENRVYEGAEIVSEGDWQSKRKRIKI